MPGRDARRTALIQVKIVALAPMPKANVVTTTNVKAGLLNSVRRLYRKSCQKVSIIRQLLLSWAINNASDLGFRRDRNGRSGKQQLDAKTTLPSAVRLAITVPFGCGPFVSTCSLAVNIPPWCLTPCAWLVKQ